jgi:hypothetical protein
VEKRRVSPVRVPERAQVDSGGEIRERTPEEFTLDGIRYRVVRSVIAPYVRSDGKREFPVTFLSVEVV